MFSRNQLAASLVCLCVVSLARADDFRVAGYLPEYRMSDFDPAAAQGVTDLIVFSSEPTATGDIDLARLKRVPWDKLQAYRSKQRARLILSLGGWGRSGGFAAIVTSAEKRKGFAQACVRLCQERRLDGMDLDWEYPNGKAQQQGYADLLGELRKVFDPHKLTLSLTISASQKLPPAAFDAADWVQVMSYDHSGRHSTYDNAVRDVKSLLDRGIAPEKIVLGIPFYGRHINERGKSLTYREILAKYKPEPAIDEIEGVYFNGADTVKRKTAYALDSKLGGVMVWELGQDARGDQSLLKIIRQTVDTHRQ